MSTLVDTINQSTLEGVPSYHSLRHCRTDAELKEALIELYGNRTLRGVELDETIREVARMICDLGTSEVSSLRWQGGAFAVFAIVGGLAGIVGAVAHEGVVPNDPKSWLHNPHPLVKEAVEKLRINNNFVRPLCQGATAFCNLGSQGYGAWAKATQDGYATAKSLAERVTLTSVRADQEHYNRTSERIASALRDLLRTNSVRG